MTADRLRRLSGSFLSSAWATAPDSGAYPRWRISPGSEGRAVRLLPSQRLRDAGWCARICPRYAPTNLHLGREAVPPRTPPPGRRQRITLPPALDQLFGRRARVTLCSFSAIRQARGKLRASMFTRSSPARRLSRCPTGRARVPGPLRPRGYGQRSAGSPILTGNPHPGLLILPGDPVSPFPITIIEPAAPNRALN